MVGLFGNLLRFSALKLLSISPVARQESVGRVSGRE
jgi:hypothetical protein